MIKTITKNKKKKSRKVTDGPIRNKERTKERIIKALEKVFKEKGYNALTNANISKEANVNHTLIRKYFGSLENLIEEYIKRKDFWQISSNERISNVIQHNKELTKFDIVFLLSDLFQKVHTDVEIQKILLWELSEKSDVMKKVADERESLGEQLFSLIDNDNNKESKFDLRAILALQIAGLYYLSLHAKSNGSLFCGVDVNTIKGRQRIINSMESIVDIIM